MSVSVAEMAGQDRFQSSAISKKRKHTDEERAERKKNKKQKHLEVEERAEVPAGATTEKTKRKKRRTQSLEEETSEPVAIQQEAQPDIELPDVEVEENVEAPATEDTAAVPKKEKKRKAVVESQPLPAEQEDIELPDAESDTSTTPATPPTDSTENTPFHTVHTSLYVPVPAISLSSALPSLISTQLTPNILTYYPPLSGVLLSISDAHLSSTAATRVGEPLLPSISSSTSPQVALCADTSGVSFTWLTFTATTFSPSPHTSLTGYINVTSEGFIGLILYNYFQVGIARTRIPRSWKWTPPGGHSSSSSRTKKLPKKGRIRDADSADSSQLDSTATPIPDSQPTPSSGETDSQLSTGYWTTSTSQILTSNTPLTFRLVSADTIPTRSSYSASSPDKLTLQLEGTLLSPDDEAQVLEEERAKFDRAQDKAYGRKESPGAKGIRHMMSGGLGGDEPGREGSVPASVVRHRVKY
jgi:DNA-directed RNA polymerase I subunit RPA43